MLNFKQLDRYFLDVSAYTALNVLCDTFKAINAVIYIDGTRFALIDLYDTMEVDGNLPAQSIKLRFFGGPSPGRWWEGTLYTMFLDHFIYAYTKGHKAEVQKALRQAMSRV
jgi:hypothetical protein